MKLDAFEKTVNKMNNACVECPFTEE